jgi:hypothetical protein
MPNEPSRRLSPAAFLIVPLAAAIVLAMFVWPSSRLEPRDLPVAVAGPPAAADAVEQKLAARDGAFEIHRYADEAAARDAIEDRDVYGAFVATQQGAKVLTASAASASVANMLEDSAAELEAPVRDVVPAPAASTGLAATVLPLIILGSVTAAISGFLAAGALRRAGLVVAGSLLAGIVATAVLQSWLDVVGGDFAANAATLSLTVLATASIVAGLQALIGQAGTILGALLMTFVGNPISGVGTAPELLPDPVGALGQLMPPGAGGNLLRSTGYFDGAAAGGHAAVLAAWSLAGLALLFVAALRARRPAPAVAPAPA